ncbi:MAG: bifunctional UDP-N-acetylglucosamine diphosphorylase/glucosamine-1-phosphate N-acetyltransferase GlmU [Firmicutes bacterium]|nr:bifunctional UDP-N-acetylglucosamine diphosphorylase/glucosamine-1-phosphate N-acetyltransferase GlmU [Bacillota bacterium]
MSIVAIVLAAGKGTRMQSAVPKVLHPICGVPIIQHVVNNLRGAGVRRIMVVVGPDGLDADLGPDIEYVTQQERLGTGHAVMQAEKALTGYKGSVLVLTGDAPLYREETLRNFIDYHSAQRALGTVLTVEVEDPTGYGRIIRDANGHLEKVVEQRDAEPSEKLIKEINSGSFVFDSTALFKALGHVTPDNLQKEYYLPDVLPILRNVPGGKVGVFKHDAPEEALGINDRIQLAEAERILRDRLREKWLLAGVTLVDPANIYIDAAAEIAPDATLMPFTFIEGNTVIGSGSVVGPFTRLQNVQVGENTSICQSTVVDSTLGPECEIGPFSYIRPGSNLKAGVKVGPFSEIKNSTIDEGSKVPHLSYIGDTDMGKRVNVGAGAITCNFDGVEKFRTTIKDDVFIGSNSNLVAPIEIGAGAFIAAGSTVTGDVLPGALAVARNRQKNIADWAHKKVKKRRSEEE